MKKLLFLSVILFSYLAVFSQQNQEDHSKRYLSLGLQTGVFHLNFYPVDFNAFHAKHASALVYGVPSSNFRKSESGQYEILESGFVFGYSASVFDAFDMKRDWRIGIFTSTCTQGYSFFKDEKVQGDTFVAGNNKIYSDTLFMEQYSYDIDYRRLGLFIEQVWKTLPSDNTSKRFYLEAGIGAAFLFDYGSTIYASHSSSYETRFYFDNNYNTYSYKSLSYDSQTKRFKTGTSVYAYIPFGASMKLSRKENLLGHLNIFAQGRGMLTFERCLDDKMRLQPGFGCNVGLRFVI